MSELPTSPEHHPFSLTLEGAAQTTLTIEKAFAKLKALLRKAAERTVSGVRQAIRRILAGITPTECANYFAAAGYNTD